MKWDGILPGIALVAVVGGLIVYANQGKDHVDPYQPLPDRAVACTELAGEPAARLDACLAELPTSALSGDAQVTIQDIAKGGKVLAAASLAVPDVPLVKLEQQPELRAALMGTDEPAAAKALRDAGVRGFVVGRDLVGALDRDSRVLARLAHHDHLEWFQLRYVTGDLLVYTVRNSRVRIPLTTGERLLEGLRARMAGQPAPKQDWTPDAIRLIGTMRLQGSTLVVRHAVGKSMERVLDELAGKMVREWERTVVPVGHGQLADRLDDVRIEVHVVMERAPVEPRSRYAIFDLWELGIDGMMFQHGEGVDNDKFTYMPGAEALTRAMKSGDEFLRFAVEQGGWHDLRPWEDATTRLDIIRTQHFMESEAGGGEAVRLIRGLPEVPMDHITDKNVQQMLVAGGEWWLENQFTDGSFEYKYWPEQNRRSTEYNEVRHILATRDLADTWRYRHDDRYLAGARKAMDWLLRYQVHDTDAPQAGIPHPPAGSMLFRYPSVAEAPRMGKPPNQKLGTVAVALLGWVAWAEATGDHSEDERIRKMAKFTLAMLEETGQFRPYYVEQGHSYYGQRNDIVPGEAALALGEVAEYFGEKEWIEFFPRFIAYYRPWFRERAEKTNPHGRWPHDTYSNENRLDLVQFGPWSVMASKQYYVLTGDPEAAEFGLEVADWMIDAYQWQGERTPWPDYVGGYYKLPQELPAMQSFCYSEGTAAAYHIAATYAPERKEKYLRSTQEAIRFLEVMQYDDTDSYFLALPKKVHGGIKYAMNENKVRIDYVGHGLSTLSQYLDARRYDPAVAIDVVDPQQMFADYVPHRGAGAADEQGELPPTDAGDADEPARAAQDEDEDEGADG